MEIEKKFLIKKIPNNIKKYEMHEIEQAYISRTPTVRIRKFDEKYILTVKSKVGTEVKEHGEAFGRVGVLKGDVIVNNEFECFISKKDYDRLLKKIDGNVVKKTRYIIPLYGDLKAELDIFHGKLEGLYFAEVEFRSVEDSLKFVKPDWFGDDVSVDKNYRNSRLSELESFFV